MDLVIRPSYYMFVHCTKATKANQHACAAEAFILPNIAATTAPVFAR